MADGIPNEAVILVGGRGTRLQTVIPDLPKPMAPVAGRPFLEWLVRRLAAAGISRAVLCTGFRSEMVEEHFGDGRRLGVEIAYSRDPVPLGTGGAVRHALGIIAGKRFFILNGDSYCEADFELMANLHKSRNAAITIWLVSVDDCSRYGTVTLRDDGAVEAFREKVPGGGSGLINAGIYLAEREAVESIIPDRQVSLETEVLPRWVGRGLFGIPGSNSFIDIGTPESYAQAEEFFSAVAHE